MRGRVEDTVIGLGAGPLAEESLRRCVWPLFSKVLASPGIYLANHSLGRPLDRIADDIHEALSLWQSRLGDAWEDWLHEQNAYRARIAQLIHAARPDLIVPKTAAGQGLRAVLNSLPVGAEVLSTRGEFDSIDVILKRYAQLGRIQMKWIEPEEDGRFTVDSLIGALTEHTTLVVVSHVMFMTGQVVHGLERLAEACHAAGARLLLDAYHSIGVLPVDVQSTHADFVIGGSYKYLRGGPGACFLYISPHALAQGFDTPDVGWFAKEDAFAYQRPDPPHFAAGGDAYLESTPPIVTCYQARAGQQFTLAVGVERLRAYSLDRLQRLKQYLAANNIAADGADDDHGAFLVMRHASADSIARRLAAMGLQSDARGAYLRLSPDCLTGDEELRCAAELVARAIDEQHRGENAR
jgi:kynureninase